MVCAHPLEGFHLARGDHEVEGGAHQVQSGGATRLSPPPHRCEGPLEGRFPCTDGSFG